MKTPRATLALTLALVSMVALIAPSAQAASQPAWALRLTPMPANYTPEKSAEMLLIATNIGGAPTTGPSQLEAVFPPGLTPTFAEYQNLSAEENRLPCDVEAATRTVTCDTAAPVKSGRRFNMQIKLSVAKDVPQPAIVNGRVIGAGAGELTTSAAPPIQSEPVPFGFLAPGFIAPMTEADGHPATFAGSHPYQQTSPSASPPKPPTTS